jgi:hypothetical protein
MSVECGDGLPVGDRRTKSAETLVDTKGRATWQKETSCLQTTGIRSSTRVDSNVLARESSGNGAHTGEVVGTKIFPSLALESCIDRACWIVNGDDFQGYPERVAWF